MVKGDASIEGCIKSPDGFGLLAPHLLHTIDDEDALLGGAVHFDTLDGVDAGIFQIIDRDTWKSGGARDDEHAFSESGSVPFVCGVKVENEVATQRDGAGIDQ